MTDRSVRGNRVKAISSGETSARHWPTSLASATRGYAVPHAVALRCVHPCGTGKQRLPVPAGPTLASTGRLRWPVPHEATQCHTKLRSATRSYAVPHEATQCHTKLRSRATQCHTKLSTRSYAVPQVIASRSMHPCGTGKQRLPVLAGPTRVPLADFAGQCHPPHSCFQI